MDICIADFNFNDKYLKLRCANLYFESLFYLYDYFKTITNSNLRAFHITMCLRVLCDAPPAVARYYRFTTYQDARRVRLVDGLETNILRVSPVKRATASERAMVRAIRA